MTWGDAATTTTAIGRSACATLAFRVGGELHVTAVVKATFALAPEGPMVLVDPEPIVRADEHRDRGPSSSLVAASELVPRRARADVLLRGHARAPLERPTPAMAVRLMVAQGQEVVIDKRLAVRGAKDPSGRTREPAPFVAMQLAWELGAATPENPVGIAEGPVGWPHIVDPRQRDQAAGFGPISPRWPTRHRLIEGPSYATIDEAFEAIIPSLPADFDWAYFNAAPEDQRMAFLRGDEWIGFEGMSSELPRVQSRLPGVRAAARAYGPASPEGRAIPLEADTVTIDTNRLSCSVVWRGSFPIPRGQDIVAFHVVGGIETAEHPLAFPALHGARRAPSARPPGLDKTLDLPAYGAAPKPATPFAPEASPAKPGAGRAATPMRPPPPGDRPLDAPASFATTLPVGARLPAAPVTPFTPTAPAPAAATRRSEPPRAPARPPAHKLAGTMMLDASAMPQLAPATPFERDPRRSPGPEPRRSEPPRAADTSLSEAPITRAPATLSLDLATLQQLAPAIPFAPGATLVYDAPRTPLPPATPFEQARLVPPPPPDGPVTLPHPRVPSDPTPPYAHERPRALSEPPRALVNLTIGQRAAVHTAPLAPPRTTAAPEMALAPTTLGGFFLAAMARAAATHAGAAR